MAVLISIGFSFLIVVDYIFQKWPQTYFSPTCSSRTLPCTPSRDSVRFSPLAQWGLCDHMRQPLTESSEETMLDNFWDTVSSQYCLPLNCMNSVWSGFAACHWSNSEDSTLFTPGFTRWYYHEELELSIVLRLALSWSLKMNYKTAVERV